jgi:osmotically-inducible protein OsmY
VGGTATGVAVIHDRRSAGTILDDKSIQFKIAAQIASDRELAEHSDASATAYNYAVLMVGSAENEHYRSRLVELASSQSGVKRVINEIQIGPATSLSRDTGDAYITAKVKLELLEIDIASFDPTRVKVVTKNHVVYLMGLVTAAEADAVVEAVRYIKGVERVVKIFEYI